MTLARYAASTSIENIPADVCELAKLVLFDEMASAHFGRRSMAGELAARYVATLGGPQEALVLGTNLRVPAPHAALANGTAGHGEEVDGAHVVGGHPGATLVHALAAVAQRQRASGAQLLNALTLSYDVAIRLVRACGEKFAMKGRHHLYSDFLFSLGAAVGACRLLGLEPIRHCHAMALATFQTNALAALYAENRHISKSFCNGQFANAGVSAALQTAFGMEGVDDILGMKDGLLQAWGVADGAAAITKGLGQEWEIRGSNFKFINAGYPIHSAVEAAMTLYRRHSIDSQTIASVQIGMPEKAMRVVDNREMHNICVQDMVCASLVSGGLSLRELPFPAILDNPAFARLRACATPEGRGSNVTIVTSSGTNDSCRIDAPRGHSTRGGVTWSDLSEKWTDGLPGHDVARMIALTRRLEELDDVNELVLAFTPPASARRLEIARTSFTS